MPRNPTVSAIEIHERVGAGVAPALIRAWVREARRDLRLKPGTIAIIFVGPTRMQSLNMAYRKKARPTNVLSFQYRPTPDDPTMGELFLCPAVIRREARDGGTTYSAHCRFLLEHGLIHLRGLDHETPAEQRQWRRWEQRLHT